VREASHVSGIEIAASAIAPQDHPWDAKMVLLATGVPEGLVTTAAAPDIPPDAEARMAAVSFGTAGALAPDAATDVFSYCEPALDDRTREALCLFSGTVTWRAGHAEPVGGVARAKLPFWLFGLAGASDPVAMKAGADVATLARELRHEGFEPTTIDAITETPTGIEVLGRRDEDAIVAVGLAPIAPFAFPYTDGPPWKLGDPPRVVPLETLKTVSLAATTKLPPKEKRKSVVFRRHK
jgi:hypothetical protein